VARRHRPPDPGRLLSILVRQQMGTFINKENARDLITLREMIDASTLTPALDFI